MIYWSGFKKLFVSTVSENIQVQCSNAVEYSTEDTLPEKTDFSGELEQQIEITEEQNDIDNNSGKYDDDEIGNNKKSKFAINNLIRSFKTIFSSKKSDKEIEDFTPKDQSELTMDYRPSNAGNRIDSFIGYAVDITGSIYMFLFVMILLIAWIIWGCVTGAPSTWQLVMQDGQSIQTYIWDTFLMRQQIDENEKFLYIYGKLKSRFLTEKKLILELRNRQIMNNDLENKKQIDFDIDEEEAILFKDENLFNKISEFVSKILGSLPAVIVYWLGIFAWIGCGAIENNNGTKDDPLYQKFSNNWQMYINTTTAIILLFTSVFLENVRARSSDFTLGHIKYFNELDTKVEATARTALKYYENNPIVEVKRPPRDKIQKGINYYAFIIGNGIGLFITACVFIVWFSIGNIMHWNANWWLVIGSYTGLVGFTDGFVLREVYYLITTYEQEKYIELLSEAQELLDTIGIQVDLEGEKINKSKTTKISLFINKICSSKWSVLAAATVVIGLVIFASALKWSETAQLIVNTPTMIIEGFFLLILIQAQHWASTQRNRVLSELAKSRSLFYKYILNEIQYL